MFLLQDSTCHLTRRQESQQSLARLPTLALVVPAGMLVSVHKACSGALIFLFTWDSVVSEEGAEA